MSGDRLCIGCKRFSLSFGEKDWSDVTPGEVPQVVCRKFKFLPMYTAKDCNKWWRKLIETAKDCDAYEQREV